MNDSKVFATECMQFVNRTVLGIVCVFGNDLLNEYELNVHNTHINEMNCSCWLKERTFCT